MSKIKTLSLYLASIYFLQATSVSFAQTNSPVQFTGSGFLTVAAGKVLSGNSHEEVSGYQCPCFISDYAQAGVYESGDVRYKPDSKLGLQGTMDITNTKLSFTGQAVARGARDGKTDLEWLYGSYKLNNAATLQLGRKRLPLFYYSESQDVGLSFPWIHLPPQLYGWEVVNYNGANLNYRTRLSDWEATLELFGGAETKRDNEYWKIYNGKDSRTDSRWTNIIGTDLSLVHDWFETRLLYIQSDIQNTDPTADNPREFSDPAKQKIYGISLNAELNDWVLRSEFLYMDRRPVNEEDYAQLYAVGYHLGKYFPMLSYTNYQMKNSPPDNETSEGHSTTSFVLRWDFSTSSDFKLQYDLWRDHSNPGYNLDTPYRNSRLLTVSYDMVF